MRSHLPARGIFPGIGSIAYGADSDNPWPSSTMRLRKKSGPRPCRSTCAMPPAIGTAF